MIDDALGDEVRVTVIAAGFDGGEPKTRDAHQPALLKEVADKVEPATTPPAASAGRPASSYPPDPHLDAPRTGSTDRSPGRSDERPESDRREPSRRPEPPAPAPGTVLPDAPTVDYDDDLDIPDFLR